MLVAAEIGGAILLDHAPHRVAGLGHFVQAGNARGGFGAFAVVIGVGRFVAKGEKVLGAARLGFAEVLGQPGRRRHIVLAHGVGVDDGKVAVFHVKTVRQLALVAGQTVQGAVVFGVDIAGLFADDGLEAGCIHNQIAHIGAPGMFILDHGFFA